MPVNVSLEFTPNPDTLKYTVNQQLLERGAENFLEAAKAEGRSPLAKRLFGVDGVKAVMVGPTFVTVTVTGQDKLMSVNTAMLREIRQHLEAGEPVVTGTRVESDHGAAGNSEIAQKIIDILDQQVRPAVAQDGGDIVFHKFEGGTVYLQMRGSCSSCPSSIATLKQGIEMRLRELIPEVNEVVQI